LDDGQQIVDADIQVSNPLPTRQIIVRLAWPNVAVEDHYRPFVVVKASAGVPPYPFENGEGTYTLNLFPNSQYAVHAEAICRAKGKLFTNSVTIDGSDLSVSEATLVFEQGRCGGE